MIFIYYFQHLPTLFSAEIISVNSL